MSASTLVGRFHKINQLAIASSVQQRIDVSAGIQHGVYVETISVTCPSCFESFEVAMPPEDECPCVVDYDCEICCRPMLISFSDGYADARSLDD